MTPARALPFDAVLWDLDGTLYHQKPLRKRMLVELGKGALTSAPWKTWRTFRWLQAFREVREELRQVGRGDQSLERLQFEEPAARLKVDAGALETLVRAWMWERPLPLLSSVRFEGVVPLLQALQERGIPMGVFSDYPVVAKLKALQLSPYFSVQICATDPEVNAFKPHPRGFEYGAERLGVACDRVLYIGDRHDVDAKGAVAAGQDYRILDPAGQTEKSIVNYETLARSLHVG